MSFLTRTPGMTLHEARAILNLHELIERALLHGPVTLEIYASIVQSRTARPDSWERHFMRTKAELAAAGFLLPSEGKGENLTADFSADKALRGEVERALDEAESLIAGRTGVRRFEEDEVEDEPHPVDAIAADHQLGLDLGRLCRRFKIGRDKMLVILHAKGVSPREARPLRVEERRDAEVLKAALDRPKGYGYVTGVARALGCHRDTARALLRRLRAL